MKFYNTNVYGLNESMIASNYPMRVDVIHNYDDVSENDIKRAKNLGATKSGSGHDCFLKGIIVQYDLTAPAYILPQFLRYHFHDIISSQSKMHKISIMDIDSQCNEWVLLESKELSKKLIYFYNNHDWNKTPIIIWSNGIEYNKEEFFHLVISNLPQGLELTFRVTSSYLQLKGMYFQRKNHKLFDWSVDFNNWLKTLPRFFELIYKDK